MHATDTPGSLSASRRGGPGPKRSGGQGRAMSELKRYRSVVADSHFPKQSLPTDIPLVFLTLPGLAAAWFGFSSDADTVLRSSLAARISLILTTFLSIVAVSCYVLQTFLHWAAGPKWEFLGIDRYLWLMLFGLSLVNLAIIGYKAVSKMLLFVWLSTKSDAAPNDIAVADTFNKTENTHEILAS